MLVKLNNTKQKTICLGKCTSFPQKPPYCSFAGAAVVCKKLQAEHTTNLKNYQTRDLCRVGE